MMKRLDSYLIFSFFVFVINVKMLIWVVYLLFMINVKIFFNKIQMMKRIKNYFYRYDLDNCCKIMQGCKKGDKILK